MHPAVGGRATIRYLSSTVLLCLYAGISPFYQVPVSVNCTEKEEERKGKEQAILTLRQQQQQQQQQQFGDVCHAAAVAVAAAAAAAARDIKAPPAPENDRFSRRGFPTPAPTGGGEKRGERERRKERKEDLKKKKKYKFDCNLERKKKGRRKVQNWHDFFLFFKV